MSPIPTRLLPTDSRLVSRYMLHQIRPFHGLLFYSEFLARLCGQETPYLRSGVLQLSWQPIVPPPSDSRRTCHVLHARLWASSPRGRPAGPSIWISVTTGKEPYPEERAMAETRMKSYWVPAPGSLSLSPVSWLGLTANPFRSPYLADTCLALNTTERQPFPSALQPSMQDAPSHAISHDAEGQMRLDQHVRYFPRIGVMIPLTWPL